MSLRVVVRPTARRDLAELSRYIAQDSPGAALRFLDAARAAFERLGFFPDAGRRRQFSHPALAGVRSWPISGFDRHVIFYRASQGRVDILRVIHSARDLVGIFGPEDDVP
ncbi:MAG TPA: type II toxin-antitoxin system RelE/ParE family toxin [Thermoanaerobaculia bacterium]|nr:type II toxin-antitoxin system RelE/ParE family toxin [Thermoanaerobaculia bacterium]